MSTAAVSTSSPVGLVLSKLNRVTGNGNQYEAQCPSHEDKRNSLSVTAGDDGRALLHCHAGCSFEAILSAAGLEKKDAFPTKKRTRAPVVATYDYVGANGRLLFQVVRDANKDFWQRRPDGAGGWIWHLKARCNKEWCACKTNPKAVTGVLYRLPQTLDAVEAGWRIFITEGEKDVGALVDKLGLEGTTNAGGVGKWKKSYSGLLRGARVVILPDHDIPGKKHGDDVARSLTGTAADVKVLHLPDLPPKGDVSDWIAAGGTRDELEHLADETDTWAPPAEVAGLPTIVGKHRQLVEMSDEAMDVLKATNDPPSIFVRGARLSGIQRDEDGRPFIDEWTASRLRGRLSRVASWAYVDGKGSETDMSPPRDVVEDIMALGEWPFPPLKAITETPILRPDGSIKTTKGYDPKTRLFYAPARQLDLAPIPEYPEPRDLKAAVSTFDEVIKDFPFIDDAGKAHVFAVALTITMRHLIDGNAPIFMLDKTKYGTGAGLLTETIALITTGHTPSMMTTPDTEDEMRKRITSILHRGNSVAVLDNVSETLASDSLSSVVTASEWEDRLLGTNETLRLKANNITWILTGNNVRVRGDLARRVVWTRLDAKLSRPWLGRTFTHTPLLDYVREHRGELLAALMTIARAWLRLGKPKPSVEAMGSFETWCHTIGGALEFAGVKGFLANRTELLDTLDDEHTEWTAFLTAIYEVMGDRSFTTREIADYIKDTAAIADVLPGEMKQDDKQLSRSLGNLFSKRLDARYEGYRVVKKGTERRAVKWAVELEEGESESEGESRF